MPADVYRTYLESLDPDVRTRLEDILAEAAGRVPDAVPCIGYGMPALRLDRIFFYVGAFRRHVGVYPPVTEPPDLVAALEAWRGPGGNLVLPHARPIPLDLLGRAAASLADTYGRRAGNA